MSNLRDDLEEWRLAQYVRSGESSIEHDLRCAFLSWRFLRKYHQEMSNPWRALDPANPASFPPFLERVLVKGNSMRQTIACVVLDNQMRVFVTDRQAVLFDVTHWTPLP